MRRKSISISEFEKKEITQAAFRRNKIYLDVDRIVRNQKVHEIKNRQPVETEKSPKSQKVNSNIKSIFRYSVKELYNKLQQQTKRFKQRVALSPINDQKMVSFAQTGDQTQRTTRQNPQIDEQNSSKESIEMFHKTSMDLSHRNIRLGKNKIKGIPIDKQISRQHLDRYLIEKNQVVDERNFNNFYITKHDLSKTQDFKKKSPRSISFIHQHINDLEYRTQKSYEKYYFSTKPMKSLFRHSLQNRNQGRKFFQPVRKQNIPKTVLEPQKVKKSFSEASNFRTNKIDSFYKMTGRDLPHQLDQRKLSPNCNYYKDKNGKIIKPEVDFAIKRLYDLVIKQKEQHYRKKNPEFTRDQICDQRYFNEMIKRENKMKFGR